MQIAQSFKITDPGVFSPAKWGSLGELAGDVLFFLTSVVGALSVIFVAIAGIRFITAGGDEKKMAAARSMITYAIIGLVVTILALVILQVVQFFLRSSVPITSQ